MNLVNISHKIMLASAVVSTIITTLAFFFFVISGGIRWPSTIWKKLYGTFLVHSFIWALEGELCSTPFWVIKEHLENPPKISRLNSLGALTLRKIKFFLKATKYETMQCFENLIWAVLQNLWAHSHYMVLKTKDFQIIQPFSQKIFNCFEVLTKPL